jgi:hypothetical protein
MIHPELHKELQAMPRKRNRGDIDWNAVLINLIENASPKTLVETGLAKAILQHFSVCELLEILTQEQRTELRRLLRSERRRSQRKLPCRSRLTPR